MLKIIVLLGLVLTGAIGFPVEEDDSLPVDEAQVYLPQSELAQQDVSQADIALAARQVDSAPEVSQHFRGGFGGGFRGGFGGGGFRGGFGGGFRWGSGRGGFRVVSGGGGIRVGSAGAAGGIGAGAALSGGRLGQTGPRAPGSSGSRNGRGRRRRPKLKKPETPDIPDVEDLETTTPAKNCTTSPPKQVRELGQYFVEDTGHPLNIDTKELYDIADPQPQQDSVELQIAAACANRCQSGLTRICRLLCQT